MGAFMVAKTLKKMLDSKSIKYVTITHSPAYTVQDVSESAHISGSKMAKTLVINADGTLALAVIPGNKKLDLNALKSLTKAKEIHLANESEFKNKFPDCEVGAMPPFGHLYDMKMYVDDSLSKEKEIGFNAGTHSEVIKINYQDYEAIAKPIHGHFVE